MPGTSNTLTSLTPGSPTGRVFSSPFQRWTKDSARSGLWARVGRVRSEPRPTSTHLPPQTGLLNSGGPKEPLLPWGQPGGLPGGRARFSQFTADGAHVPLAINPEVTEEHSCCCSGPKCACLLQPVGKFPFLWERVEGPVGRGSRGAGGGGLG